MTRIKAPLRTVLILGMLAGGCSGGAPEPDTRIPDAWVGAWAGPEGTLLRIEGGQGAYTVTVRDLDGPRSFPGRAAEDAIEFERDGVIEHIVATDGPGTGMKWLTEKRDCLVIRPGEGFCRDGERPYQ